MRLCVYSIVDSVKSCEWSTLQDSDHYIITEREVSRHTVTLLCSEILLLCSQTTQVKMPQRPPCLFYIPFCVTQRLMHSSPARVKVVLNRVFMLVPSPSEVLRTPQAHWMIDWEKLFTLRRIFYTYSPLEFTLLSLSSFIIR